MTPGILRMPKKSRIFSRETPALSESSSSYGTIRSSWKHALLIFIVLLGCLFATLFYIQDVSSFFLHRSITDLSRTAQFITRAFQGKVNDNIINLQTLAFFLGRYDSLTDPALLRELKAYGDKFHYMRVAVTTPEGISHTDDGFIHDSRNRAYFQESIRGKSLLTGPYTSVIDDSKTVVISVPLYREKRIVGVLRATQPASEYKRFLREIIREPQINVYLINSEGTVIANSGDFTNANLLEGILEDDLISSEEIRLLINDLNQGENRLLKYTQDGEERYVFFNSAVDDIFVVTSVPVSYEYAGFLRILQITTYLVLSLMVLFLGLALYIVRYRRKTIRQIRDINQELNSIVSNIPGGVQRCLNDGVGTILFLSDGFLKLVGYTRAEIREFFHNQYVLMIHATEREEIRYSLAQQLRQSDAFELSYRIRRKSGDWIWVSHKGLLVQEDDKEMLYSVILDINEQKEALDRSFVNAETHRLLLEVSGDILFEFDMMRGVLVCSKKFGEKFGLPVTLYQFPDSIRKRHLVHKDDLPAFLQLFEDLYNGHDTVEAEARLRIREGRYLWYHLLATVVVDSNRDRVKAVGKMVDIDEQKRSLAELQAQSQKDPFTQLFNKAATQELIAQYLVDADDEKQGALFVIDTDNFKTINDTLGHPIGDKVLRELSDALRNLFRSTDIIGRLGGDEFLVFVKQAGSREFCMEKAEKIGEAFRKNYGREGKRCRTSASIGIALFPKDGKDYATLYQHADQALYQVKQAGKDHYAFYDGI